MKGTVKITVTEETLDGESGIGIQIETDLKDCDLQGLLELPLSLMRTLKYNPILYTMMGTLCKEKARDNDVLGGHVESMEVAEDVD